LFTGSVARSPAGRRRSRVAVILLPLLGLLAGAGIAVALLEALADPDSAPAEAAQQRDSGSIVLDAGQYVGRPVDEVVPRLTRLGLDVQPRGEARDDVVPDEVTGVEPDGKPLEAGDTVVVTYAIGNPSGDRPAVTGASGGGGTTVEVQQEDPTTADVPAPGPVKVPTDPSTPADTLPATPTPTGTTAAETTPSETPHQSDTPSAGPTTTEPATGTTTESATGSSTTKPATGSSTTKPATGSSTTKPATGPASREWGSSSATTDSTTATVR
jgi:hypothetical protein